MSDFDIVAVRNKRLSDSSCRSVGIPRDRINPPHAPPLLHEHFNPAAALVQMLTRKLNRTVVIGAIVICEALALPILTEMIEAINRH